MFALLSNGQVIVYCLFLSSSLSSTQGVIKYLRMLLADGMDLKKMLGDEKE